MTIPSETAPLVAEVYWRPGCPYCAVLRRGLSRRGVPSRWHDIWSDEDARRFVRAANRGCETVPTVRVGATTLTNPSASQVAALVSLASGAEHRQRRRRSRSRIWSVLSWLPTIALVAGSFAVESAGHVAVSWAFDGFAIAAWWLTRPLRR